MTTRRTTDRPRTDQRCRANSNTPRKR